MTSQTYIMPQTFSLESTNSEQTYDASRFTFVKNNARRAEWECVSN